MTEPTLAESASERPAEPSWGLSLALFAATFASTTYTGALHSGVDPLAQGNWSSGLGYSAPLMAILLSHELAHYVAGRRHGIPVSPPYFIPMPFFMLGTMGAVILIQGRIRNRNALLDLGASGPLVGLAVALPVLAYGLWTSPVQELPNETTLMEGRSILYLALLWLTKGAIAPGQDIFLSGTALAGWAGLLVTMLNLIPVGQLDGGHVAYALFGPRQQVLSRRMRGLLPWIALCVAGGYWMRGGMGTSDEALLVAQSAGAPWLVWWLALSLMRRLSGTEHPPTDDGELTPGRRVVAAGTLALFVLLFMPTAMVPDFPPH